MFNSESFPSPLDVQNNDDLGASIGLENDDDLFLWNVTFEGPESSLYEVSCFGQDLLNLAFFRKIRKNLDLTLLSYNIGWILQDAAPLPPGLPEQPTRDEIYLPHVAPKQ